MRTRFTIRLALTTMCFAVGTIGLAAPASGADVVSIGVGDRPVAVEVNQETHLVYVADTDAASVSVLDGKTNTLAATIPLSGKPSDLAVNSRTNTIYVTEPVSGTVSIIDGATNTVTGISAAGAGASALDVDETTNMIYTTSRETGDVGVIDGTSAALATTVPSAVPELSEVSVDAGRGLAYFTSPQTDTVEVLDTVSNSFGTAVPVGMAPADVSVQGPSNTVYVANSGIHHMSVIDGASGNEEAQILLASAGSSVATAQDTGAIYSNGGPDGVVKIDGKSQQVVAELSLGINPGGIGVDEGTDTLYVTDPLHDSVSAVSRL